MSRWAKRAPEETPQTAEDYEKWFNEKVQEYKANPNKPQMIAPKQIPSAWQLEGMRLVLEKRAREALVDKWGW